MTDLWVPREVVTDPERHQGDCFAAAAKLVLSDPSFTLVHAKVTTPDRETPRRPDQPRPGERHDHAWAEKRAPVRLEDGKMRNTVVCVDLSSGRHVAAPRELYYRLGKIGKTFRYSMAQVHQLVTEHEHWGPWRELP